MGGRSHNSNNNGRSPSGSALASSIALALAAVACQLRGDSLLFANAQSSSSAKGCVADYNATADVDYFPDKAVIAYAQNFEVEYFNSYKVLTTTSSSYGSATYVLYQCGTTKPVLADVEVQEYISIPVDNVATGTPDHIPRIEVRVWSVICLLYCAPSYYTTVSCSTIDSRACGGRPRSQTCSNAVQELFVLARCRHC